jgi:hypothetical protein
MSNLNQEPNSDSNTTSAEPQSISSSSKKPNLARDLDKALMSNKKILLVLIPLGLLLVALVIGGFFWYKNNFLDGRKADIKQKFTSINYNVPYEVQIIKSDKNRIEITKNDNPYDDEIDFVVTNSELKVTNKPKVSVPKSRAQTVIIYTSNLSKIVNNDKGNIQIDSIASDEIEIDAKDKGNITVGQIQSKKLITSVRDTGDITVKSGKTESIEASIVNSSGKINLEGVESPTAKTKDIGTGTIKLNATTVDQTKEKGKKK